MLKKIKLKDLVPFDKNPRINDKAVDRVLESLKANGYVSPIVVNEIGYPFKEHVIAAGHTRWKALDKFGSKEVEVFVYKFDSEKHFVRYNIEDNKTAEFAEWDETVLAELSAEFDIDLDAMEFEFDVEEEPAEGLTDEDEVPDVPDVPVAKLGQIWKLGEHRLMCGDSTDKATVEALMDGEKIDLLLTDPPYGIDYGGMLKGKGDGKGGADKNGWKSHDAPEWDRVRPEPAVFDCMLTLATNSIIWGGNYFADIIPATMGWLIWDKGQRGFSLADGEMAWTSFNNALRIKSYARATANKEEKHHPTQKPVEIMEWCVKYADRHSKKEVVTIMDVYTGSGTTLLTCEKMKRKAFCIELDPKYCDVIIKRWEDFTGLKSELINA